MKMFLFLILAIILTSVSALGQGSPRTPANPHADQQNTGLPPVFTATKEQISMAQAFLKERSLYEGEPTGKYNKETQEAIKSFQRENGLRDTGRLNRATTEMMNIPLTGIQRQTPVTADSFAKPNPKNRPANQNRPSRTTAEFEPTEEQIVLAQRILKTDSLFNGKENGKLDKDTREGLKGYQKANGIETSGNLDRTTLEKMGIELTEKQRSVASLPAVKVQD